MRRASEKDVIPLTPKHARFVAEYLIDSNATQAAIRCGYRAKSAHVQGARMLRNVKVRAELTRRQAEQAELLGVTADRVVLELARLAFANVQDHVTPKGDPRALHQMPRSVTATIASYEIVLKNATAGDDKIDRVLRVKREDKTPALIALARRFGLLIDKVQVSGIEGLDAKIAAARQRGAALAAERAGTKA
jgi:phage terminase small subunit